MGSEITTADIDLSGLGVTKADMEHLLEIDKEAWKAEIESIRENY